MSKARRVEGEASLRRELRELRLWGDRWASEPKTMAEGGGRSGGGGGM